MWFNIYIGRFTVFGTMKGSSLPANNRGKERGKGVKVISKSVL